MLRRMLRGVTMLLRRTLTLMRRLPLGVALVALVGTLLVAPMLLMLRLPAPTAAAILLLAALIVPMLLALVVPLLGVPLLRSAMMRMLRARLLVRRTHVGLLGVGCGRGRHLLNRRCFGRRLRFRRAGRSGHSERARRTEPRRPELMTCRPLGKAHPPAGCGTNQCRTHAHARRTGCKRRTCMRIARHRCTTLLRRRWLRCLRRFRNRLWRCRRRNFPPRLFHDGRHCGRRKLNRRLH